MCRACNTSKNADTVTWISIANFSLLCEWRAPPWNHRPWQFPHTDGPPPHPPPAPLPQPVTSGTAGDSYRDNRNIGAGRPRDDDGGGGGAGWRPRLGAAITLFGSEVTLGPEHVLGLVTIGVLGGVEVRPSHSYALQPCLCIHAASRGCHAPQHTTSVIPGGPRHRRPVPRLPLPQGQPDRAGGRRGAGGQA